MSIEDISVQRSPNVESLTVLICHLLIGGNFQVAHFLYEPNTLDSRLVKNLQCLDRVTCFQTDITTSFNDSSHWNNHKRKNRTLQLIFLQSIATTNYVSLEKYSVYHRLFIFIEDDLTIQQKIYEIDERKINSIHGSLFSVHDTKSRTTKIYVLKQTINEQPIYIHDEDTIDESIVVFEKTFGTFDNFWLGANFHNGFKCLESKKNKCFIFINVSRWLAHLYYTKMEMSFIAKTTYNCGDSPKTYDRRFVRHIEQSVYSEFSFDTEPIENLNSWPTNQQLEIHFLFHEASIGSTNQTKITPLYPSQNLKVTANFIYGNDYQRQIGPPSMSEFLLNYWFVPLLFLSTTTALYVIRCKTSEKKIGLSSTILDMMVIFFGGGSLRFHNKFERDFIIVLLVGMFFLQSIWVGDFLSAMSDLQNKNSVDTFEKLIKLQTPIFPGLILAHEKENVVELLKKRMGSNLNLKEPMMSAGLAKMPYSTVFVAVKPILMDLKLLFNTRDIDVVKETLYEYSTSFYLRSEHILSERIIERFNRMTSFIVESGIHDFYWSMAEYLMELKRVKPVSNSVYSFSLDNIVSLFLMFLVSMGVALLTFLMEIVWFHVSCYKFY